MRAAVVFIACFLLPSCAGVAQTNVTTERRFPQTGIANLELTFQQLEKLLPAEANVLHISFPNPDSALVTLWIGRGTSATDFDFRRVDGAWKKFVERDTGASFPSGGIGAAELDKALVENKENLPEKGILDIIVTGPTAFEVLAGIRYGPRAGSGTVFPFVKRNGKWNKTAIASWRS
jgi:hypothetical protein